MMQTCAGTDIWEFEAMITRQFMGELLKDQFGTMLGDGMEKDFYVSMFADAVSEQIAKSGGLGLSKII